MGVLYGGKYAKHINVFCVQINFIFMIFKEAGTVHTVCSQQLERHVQCEASSSNATYIA
jgi:hypothetical protein